jgi:hypothetical protein
MFWKRAKRDVNVTEALRMLAKGQHDLGQRILMAEEKLEALKSAHEALRGRFYASRGGGSDPPAPQSKAEILRSYGFVPGRPTPHK